jgi:hypothetical protein
MQSLALNRTAQVPSRKFMVGGFQQRGGYANPGNLVFMESMGIHSNGVVSSFTKRRAVSATGGGSVTWIKYAATDFAGIHQLHFEGEENVDRLAGQIVRAFRSCRIATVWNLVL